MTKLATRSLNITVTRKIELDKQIKRYTIELYSLGLMNNMTTLRPQQIPAQWLRSGDWLDISSRYAGLRAGCQKINQRACAIY